MTGLIWVIFTLSGVAMFILQTEIDQLRDRIAALESKIQLDEKE